MYLYLCVVDPVSGMQLPTPKCQPKPKPTAAAPVPTVLTTTGDNVTVIGGCHYHQYH